MMEIQKVLPYGSPPAIAVIGDICLDLYYFTGKEGAEISVETGLQSYSVFKTRQGPGGAGNVAVNCKSLGAGKVDLYGLVGNDCWAGIVKDLLAQWEIGHEGVLTQDTEWQTHVYHKIYNGREELPRFDMGNQNRPQDAKISALLELLEARLDKYQCVIINEQVPAGIHSSLFQKKLAALIDANKNKVQWFSDCRKLTDRYNHTLRKLNIREAREIIAASGGSLQNLNTPPAIAAHLYNRWKLPVVLTLGEEGALIYDETGCTEFNSVHLVNEIDVAGAGDAFLAGLVTARGAGLGFYEAATIATFSAGVSLGKLFETGHPTVSEVIALAEEGNFNYHPRLAADSSLAHYAKETEIEIISPDFVRRNASPPKYAIFDHDGTISVLRQGWEKVMYAVMLDAITGRICRSVNAAPEISRKESDGIQKAVSALIEKTTGIQTLAQMYQLRELVRSFAYVKEADLLTPEEYKAVYNRALLANVEKRMSLTREKKLNPEDVTIKGAAAFLKKLESWGTKLYLASGTDQEDVIQEARILGYERLFSGGIRGSVGDIKNDPKKLVIRGIIADIKNNGGNPTDAAVFGDGPVEMREAKKAGILAVGVLSDECRRWGRNLEKRERLVLGGADLLIPDFSWSSELAHLCGWE
jgi:bifunctional ADP-heptose synthase (sugar kinase/adenylyltransferase)/phosphoglycolate phosphatase-like HAD superfamily hydrolase